MQLALPKEDRAQPYLRRGRKTSLCCLSAPSFLASALTMDELRSTEKDERVLAQLFQVSSKKRGFYRKNKSLNQKQHGKVPAQVATGDPWSKELTDLLHWEKLQLPRTSFWLQGKVEHEVPPTDKNLARHEYAWSIAPAKKSGQRRLVFSVSGWIFCLRDLGFYFLDYPKDKRDPQKVCHDLHKSLSYSSKRQNVLVSASTSRMGTMGTLVW